MAWAANVRRVPELRFVSQFHDDPGYIDALAQSVHRPLARNGRGERLVLSFHGIARRSMTLGDPYHCQCQETARLLAERFEHAGRRVDWSAFKAASAELAGLNPIPSPRCASWPRKAWVMST